MKCNGGNLVLMFSVCCVVNFNTTLLALKIFLKLQIEIRNDLLEHF